VQAQTAQIPITKTTQEEKNNTNTQNGTLNKQNNNKKYNKRYRMAIKMKCRNKNKKLLK
jgi:hypothetical protein